MPKARTIKHQCEHVYTAEEAQYWGQDKKHHRGLNAEGQTMVVPWPHKVGERCKNAAVEFPKRSGKFEKFCASHIRAEKKCRTTCRFLVHYGSHSKSYGDKMHIADWNSEKKRYCKRCPMPNDNVCKLHRMQINEELKAKRKPRAVSAATLRLRRIKEAGGQARRPARRALTYVGGRGSAVPAQTQAVPTTPYPPGGTGMPMTIS
jgi:hypothetical protein